MYSLVLVLLMFVDCFFLSERQKCSNKMVFCGVYKFKKKQFTHFVLKTLMTPLCSLYIYINLPISYIQKNT